MRGSLIVLKDIGVTFGGDPLFSHLELAIQGGERAVLVGRNGSGKSTLLKLMAGEIEADRGMIVRTPGVRISYLRQDPAPGAGGTVLDHVTRGIAEATGRHRAEAALRDMDFDGGIDGARPLATLSGGERRKADLAQALASAPDLLLLDEPTNHLDLPAILRLEERLRQFPGAVVMVSHDRAFLRALSRRILWLDRRKLREKDAGFDAFDDWAEAVREQEARESAHLAKRIAAETRWSHEGVTARRRRNQGRLKRLEEMRRERGRRLSDERRPDFAFTSRGRGSALVIEARQIRKSFGKAPVVRDFSTRILKGDRVGVIGPNGSGKTTLLGLLTGRLAPDEGTVRLGRNLEIAYFDQTRQSLDPDETPWSILTGGTPDHLMVRGEERHVVSYLESFLFTREQARTPIKALSGGERNRLLLAKLMARPADMLVLDEPTNDLDMETLALLEDGLGDYDGTIIVASHDRDFIDRVVTSTIAVEGGGIVTEYAGGFRDYMIQSRGGFLARGGRARPNGRDVPPRRAPRLDSASNPRRSSRKLGYKDERELEALPDRIALYEREIAQAESALADPDLFGRDPERYTLLAARIEAAKAALADAEERWVELETKREALEDGAG